MNVLLSTAFVFVLLPCFAAADPGAINGPGISKRLATQRKKQLSGITYDLKLAIPDHVKERIQGAVTIRFDLKNDAAPVTLDARLTAAEPMILKKITVNSRELKLPSGGDHVIIPASHLKAGPNEVDVGFVAGETGLHRRDDFLYTLFVPDNASKVFPCFDQPDLKARYRLTLTVPKDWKAVSQSSVDKESASGATKTVTFAESKPTSTYLIAFAAGRFQTVKRRVDGREMTLYHLETDRKKVERNVDAIFDLHAKALRWLENYTGLPFPFEKFDFVVLPAFPFSGMEHPGSIFYSDKSLFLDESATRTQVLFRANVIAHETSHMWFGDLVTMKWFDDVWLKEVFANFMADKIADPLFPEINHDVRFFLSHYPEAYRVDRTKGTNPIAQKLDNLNEASTLYGDIIYNKAPVAMRQLEKFIGPEAFHQGIKEYLKDHQYGNATWADLIAVLERHAKKPLKKWNHDWILSAGMPVLSAAQSSKGGFTIKSQDLSGRGLVWPQTLTLALGTAAIPVGVAAEIDRPVTKIAAPKPAKPLDYVLTGARDPGYGLFLLDAKTVRFLAGHLADIPDENVRAVAWVDAVENVITGKIPPGYVVNLALDALPREANEQIIDFALRNASYVYWALLPEAERKKFSDGLEKMLWARVNASELSKFARASFFKTFEAVFASGDAWKKLHDVWSGQAEIKDLTFSELDKMTMAYELALRRPDLTAAISESQSRKIKDPERKSEFQFVVQAAGGTQKERNDFFGKILGDEAYRKNEPWVREALYYFHHPLHGSDSVNFVKLSLELLPEIRRTGGIFFPLDWLNGTLAYHVDPETACAVHEYLRKTKRLPKGLRLKVLQASDVVTRFEYSHAHCRRN